MEVTLEGTLYKGRFIGQTEFGQREVCSHQWVKDIDNYHWEGVGSITKKETGKQQEFRFSTDYLVCCPGISLEDAIIKFERMRPGAHLMNVDRKVAIDYVLGHMYEKSRIREEKDIVPLVQPVEIPLYVQKKETPVPA